MKTEIENLIFYIREYSKDEFDIAITKKGFNVIFKIHYRLTETLIEVDQEGFYIKSKKFAVRVDFREQSLEYKFKLITNYMELIKQISWNVNECSMNQMKGD